MFEEVSVCARGSGYPVTLREVWHYVYARPSNPRPEEGAAVLRPSCQSFCRLCTNSSAFHILTPFFSDMERKGAAVGLFVGESRKFEALFFS